MLFFHFTSWSGWSLLAFVIVNPLWPFGQSFCGWIFSFLLGGLVVGLWGHLVNTDLASWETARPSPQAIVPSCVESGWCLPGTCGSAVFTNVPCCCCLSHWHLMSAECPFVVLMYISLITGDVEHLSMCLLAINLSFWGKCWFRPFAHYNV